MIQAIILIVLAIVIAPILLPVLIGATGFLFTFYKEAFTDPDVPDRDFRDNRCSMVPGCLGQGRHERQTWPKKENRIGLFGLNFKPLTYNSENKF